MNLDTSKWKGFKIDSLFNHFERGKANQTKLEEGSDLFYVGAKRDDNGVMLRCAYNETLVSAGNCVVFISNGQGSVGYANYMDANFVASTDLVLGYADWLTPEIGLFLATIFSLERPKYSFGRKWGRFLRETVVDLPIQRDEAGEPIIDPSLKYNPEGFLPDWQFMENFIESLNHRPITTKNFSKSAQSLEIDEFTDFTLGNLVSEIYKAKAHTKEDVTEVAPSALEVVETIRYVTRTAENNGCELLAVRTNELESGIEKGNAISIGDTTATCFYQGEDFVAGDHMVVIRADWLNPFTGNFITTLLNRESYRYSYGRAFIMNSIRETSIKLPIRHDEVGNPIIDPTRRYHTEGYIPDWQFMENYIRSLPYGDRIPDTDSDINGVGGD